MLGGESAEEWAELVDPACAALGIGCTLGGDGYGPSDHTPFYAAGVPVLHFFTGVHDDYHKPSDDTPMINAAGGARVAASGRRPGGAAGGARGAADLQALVVAAAPTGDAALVRRLARHGARLRRAAGRRPGVLLAGVRPESAAEKAGLRRGDLLVELAGARDRATSTTSCTSCASPNRARP